MLVAEIHGKVLSEAQNHEDYLTSAVFGLLRFIKPAACFWPVLLAKTKSCDPQQQSIVNALGQPITEYQQLRTWFWPTHRLHGQPDLILEFVGGAWPPLLIAIEVKLFSGMSSWGEDHQLVRYLRFLDDWESSAPRSHRYLIYLTPRESLDEIQESLQPADDQEAFRSRTFRLRWQDILEVAKSTADSCDDPYATILSDIAEFLERRGLQYFTGFQTIASLNDEIDDASARFWNRTRRFEMTRIDTLKTFALQRGQWTA